MSLSPFVSVSSPLRAYTSRERRFQSQLRNPGLMAPRMVAEIGPIRRRKRFGSDFIGDPLVLFHDLFFDHGSSLVIDRMSDIFIAAVLSLFARHGNEVPGIASNDLEISDRKTVVQSDCYIGSEFFLIDWKH